MDTIELSDEDIEIGLKVPVKKTKTSILIVERKSTLD